MSKHCSLWPTQTINFHTEFSNSLHAHTHTLQEFFGDYIAVGHHLFSFNLAQVCHPGAMWRRDDYLRIIDGVVSVMLALRKRPVIR